MYHRVWFPTIKFFPVLTELAGETSGLAVSPVSHVECLEAIYYGNYTLLLVTKVCLP